MSGRNEGNRRGGRSPHPPLVITGAVELPVEVWPWEVELLRPMFTAVAARREVNHAG